MVHSEKYCNIDCKTNALVPFCTSWDIKLKSGDVEHTLLEKSITFPN